MKTPRWTQKRAVAEHIGMNLQDIDSYRYQPGRTGSVAVFAVGNDYFCALPERGAGALPAWIRWEQQQDRYVEHYGWKVFRGSMPTV